MKRTRGDRGGALRGRGCARRRAQGALTVAAFVFPMFLMYGCNGCNTNKVRGAYLRAVTWNTPKCTYDEECMRVWSCPPEEEPRCSPYAGVVGNDHRFCYCDSFRPLPNPDGGKNPIIGK